MTEREQIINEILDQEPTFLEKAKKKVNGRPTWICPKCGNGSGTDGDGIVFNKKSKSKHAHYHCFKCGLSGDVIELYQAANGIDDFNQAIEELQRYYNISGNLHGGGEYSHESQDKTPIKKPEKKQEQNQAQAEKEPDLMPYFEQCRARIASTDYPQKRGLSSKVINDYWLGYDPQYTTDAGTWKALIIPTGRANFIARNTDINAEKGSRYRKKGAAKLFNLKALESTEKPVFIVEGEIDALSIMTAGGAAVGLGSTSNTEKLIEAVKGLKHTPPLIIAMDNDDAGKEAAEKLESELNALELDAFTLNPYGGQKDANAALLDHKEDFYKTIQSYRTKDDIINQIKAEKRAEYMQNSAAAHIQDFIDGISASANTPATPTGFKALDRCLEDGLREGLYILGAISSLGKTTLILQIADQIAAQGQDVLIFSLEMARSELMAKSISRHTLLNVQNSGGDIGDAKTEIGITSGERYHDYSDKELALIEKSIKDYNQYAGHIFIKEGIGDIGVTAIRKAVKDHITFTGNKPIVFVDYIQILAPYNERATDKQNMDKAVLELKRISRDYKIPVIGISAFNRLNYNTAVTMAAFKESGAIEYSSDVLLGLQLEGVDAQGFDESRAKQENPRKIELVILKQRKGRIGKKIKYEYYPLFNYYKEIGEA